MSTKQHTAPAEASVWGMSDEAFLNQGLAQFETEAVSEESLEAEVEQDEHAETVADTELESTDTDADHEEEAAEGDTDDDAEPEAEEEAVDEAEANTAENADAADSDESEADADSDRADDAEAADDDDSADADTEKADDADSSEVIDYKAEYEKLLAPFKANGREMQVRNVDEAVRLMQMGANYNKKMAALKPNLKMLKLLERNDLLDEQKLSYLIDLDKKHPDAIKKLIKESGIDPLELDVSEDVEYKPNTYTVHDREIDLDQTLDELQDTPTYSRLLDVVSNKWDTASKNIIANQPQLLHVLNDHLASGIYDVIVNELERERAFGHLQGLSDLEAYKQIGDRLHAQGAFNHLVAQPQAAATQQPAAQKVTKPVKPKATKEDASRRSRKRAASPSRQATSPSSEPDYNPLAMSDEEFAKLMSEKLPM